MDRFAAMVSSRRAAAAAAAPASDGEEVKENVKRKLTAAEEAYLRIQLEEIVVVKNEDVARLAAPRGTNHLGGASARAYVPAAAAPAAATTAARGAVSTTVGWIAGSN